MTEPTPLRPLRPPDVAAPVAPAPNAYGQATTDGEHRRLLVGSLVVRRIAYRSVLRVAWPFFGALYALGFALAAVAWNIAALAGWEPTRDGVDAAWTTVALGVVAVPTLVAGAVALAALYNVVSERCGGIEVSVVSPRRYRTDRHRR